MAEKIDILAHEKLIREQWGEFLYFAQAGFCSERDVDDLLAGQTFEKPLEDESADAYFSRLRGMRPRSTVSSSSSSTSSDHDKTEMSETTTSSRPLPTNVTPLHLAMSDLYQSTTNRQILDFCAGLGLSTTVISSTLGVIASGLNKNKAHGPLTPFPSDVDPSELDYFTKPSEDEIVLAATTIKGMLVKVLRLEHNPKGGSRYWHHTGKYLNFPRNLDTKEDLKELEALLEAVPIKSENRVVKNGTVPGAVSVLRMFTSIYRFNPGFGGPVPKFTKLNAIVTPAVMTEMLRLKEALTISSENNAAKLAALAELKISENIGAYEKTLDYLQKVERLRLGEKFKLSLEATPIRDIPISSTEIAEIVRERNAQKMNRNSLVGCFYRGNMSEFHAADPVAEDLVYTAAVANREAAYLKTKAPEVVMVASNNPAVWDAVNKDNGLKLDPVPVSYARIPDNAYIYDDTYSWKSKENPNWLTLLRQMSLGIRPSRLTVRVDLLSVNLDAAIKFFGSEEANAITQLTVYPTGRLHNSDVCMVVMFGDGKGKSAQRHRDVGDAYGIVSHLVRIGNYVVGHLGSLGVETDTYSFAMEYVKPAIRDRRIIRVDPAHYKYLFSGPKKAELDVAEHVHTLSDFEDRL